MFLGVVTMSAMGPMVRLMSDAGVHTFQIVFLRNAFSLLVMLPWLIRVGRSALQTQRLGLHAARCFSGLISMMAWFYSLGVIPLAEATALNFTSSLFVTLGAALFLKERLRLRRSLATLAGFVGVLIIVRPGFQEASWLRGVPVLSALLMAASLLMVKSLSRTEKPTVMVFYMAFFMTVMSAPPAMIVWTWPDNWLWLPGIGLGVSGIFAHFMISNAMTYADASSLVPLSYVQMPITTILAWLFFSELPDLWTWIGCAVVVAANLYIAHREARLAKGS